MDTLPNEIIVKFIEKLGMIDLLAVRRVNKRLYGCSYIIGWFVERITMYFGCKGCYFKCKCFDDVVLDMVANIPGFDLSINRNFALRWATRNGRCQVVKYLHEHGVDIHNKTALLNSIAEDSVDIVKYLITQGVDIHVDDESALRMATKRGFLNITRLLVDAGADISVKNNVALLKSVSAGNLAVARYLLDHGADVHAGNDAAFRTAAEYCCLYMMKMLLEYGANIHVANDYALRIASSQGRADIVQYLIERGANIQHSAQRKTKGFNQSKLIYRVAASELPRKLE